MDGRLEKKLVARCRNGDKSAYAGLVKACAGRVYAICLGMLGNRHDAEDVAQQTLLKGFTDIDKLQDVEQFGAWIGQIARNLCIDSLRSRKRKESALAVRARGGPNDPRDYGELEAALGKLDERHRLVLMLYYFDGRSTRNIGDILEINESAVHARMSRARKHLRKLLEAERGV